jgi:hypothetical protein
MALHMHAKNSCMPLRKTMCNGRMHVRGHGITHQLAQQTDEFGNEKWASPESGLQTKQVLEREG